MIYLKTEEKCKTVGWMAIMPLRMCLGSDRMCLGYV